MYCRDFLVELDAHPTLIAGAFGGVARAAKAQLFGSEEAWPAAELRERVRGIAPRAAGREKPVRAVVRRPLRHVAGHVVGAKRAHPELRAGRGQDGRFRSSHDPRADRPDRRPPWHAGRRPPLACTRCEPPFPTGRSSATASREMRRTLRPRTTSRPRLDSLPCLQENSGSTSVRGPGNPVRSTSVRMASSHGMVRPSFTKGCLQSSRLR